MNQKTLLIPAVLPGVQALGVMDAHLHSGATQVVRKASRTARDSGDRVGDAVRDTARTGAQAAVTPAMRPRQQ